MLKPISNQQWSALTFLATHDRWIRLEHARKIPLVSVRSLARLGLADLYSNYAHAWIEPDGILYLIENIDEVKIQYSMPAIEPGRWHPGERLAPRYAAERRQLAAKCLAVQERQASRLRGQTPVTARIYFARKASA